MTVLCFCGIFVGRLELLALIITNYHIFRSHAAAKLKHMMTAVDVGCMQKRRRMPQCVSEVHQLKVSVS